MYLKRYLKKTLLAIVISLTSITSFINCQEQNLPTKPNVIIWDLGGVLMDSSFYNYANHIGFTNLGIFLACDWFNPLSLGRRLQNQIFNLLSQVDLQQPEGFINTRTRKGDPLPYVISACQAGLINPSQALELAMAKFDELDKAGNYFLSNREKEVVRKALDATFTPAVHSASVYTYPKGLNLVKRISEIKDENGNRKFKQYILSNWEPESFEIVKNNLLQDYLDCFEDIICSGQMGTVKPNIEAFNYILNKHNLDPVNCVFIDDQQENIVGAKEAGIENSILFKKHAELENTLKSLEIL